MSGQLERLAAGATVKSLPMTINDRGRNQAQAGRALHAPAEARRAFRDLARAEAAKPLERRPGQQGVGRVPSSTGFPFPGLLLLSSEIWLSFVYCFAQGFAWSELNQLLFRHMDRLAGCVSILYSPGLNMQSWLVSNFMF